MNGLLHTKRQIRFIIHQVMRNSLGMPFRVPTLYRATQNRRLQQFLLRQIHIDGSFVTCRRNLHSVDGVPPFVQQFSVRYYSSSNQSDEERIPSRVNLPTSTLSFINDNNKLMPASTRLVQSGRSLFDRKKNSFFEWYDQISHTNEVRDAHKQVEELQDNLNQAQQLRREVSKELNNIRYELQLCYADLANCQKGEPRYLELIRKEYDIHHKEKQKTEEFNLLDKAERDLFILLQAAVKTSHEKEKIHTNSAKYWSIVGSLAGALLGILGTAFSFYNRNDLLSDINKEFVVIRDETKTIAQQIEVLMSEQRSFIDWQRLRDREMLERESRINVRTLIDKKNQENAESWIHWIGRHTYVISIYRYFMPRSNT